MSQMAPTAPIDLSLPQPAQLEEAVALAAAAARAGGASGFAIAASAHTGLSLALREQEVESLEFQRDRDLGITVYFGQRKGNAGTADFRPEAIQEAVAAACSIARHTQDDAANGLPDADRLATHFPDLQLDHPSRYSLEQLLQTGRACEARGLAHSAISASDGLHLSASRHSSLLHNSDGFHGWRQSSDYGLSLTLIGEDAGGKRRDYWYSHALDDSAYAQADAVADQAIERVRRGLNPRQPRTGRYPVLFPPELARGLIGSLLGAISGGALYRRASFLLEAMDSPLFPQSVQILQRPLQARQFGSASFDAEGVATAERALVEDGILRGWLLGSYSARKLGLSSTGNAGGAQRIEVAPTFAGGLKEMMREAGSGLLLTSLMGQGVKLTTGDYSRGATGIWFENGEPAYPVHECTIAGNLREMFRDLQAIGHDVDPHSSIAIGSLWLAQMTIAGEDQPDDSSD